MAIEAQRRVTGSSAYSANRGSQIHNRSWWRSSWRMTFVQGRIIVFKADPARTLGGPPSPPCRQYVADADQSNALRECGVQN
jgi:hypothetical protein